MLDKIVDEILAKHDATVAELEGQMLALLAFRAGDGKEWEDARRRLMNHKSVTTYPDSAAEAIKRDLHKRRAALAKAVAVALPLALEIELLEREQKHLNELMDEIRVGRTELKEARYWPTAAAFALKLYERFGIQHSYYALLSDDDIAMIGQLILRRRDERLAAAATIQDEQNA